MESTEALLFEELFECNLFSCLISYRFDIVGIHIIMLGIFSHLSVNFFLGNSINELDNIAYTEVVNLPAELNLCFNLITVCYSYIAHIVGYTKNAKFSAFSCTDCGTHPNADFILYGFILPIACNYLLLKSHSCGNVAVLSVTVGRLIKIHKVHINISPRDISVKLCIYVKKRLF